MAGPRPVWKGILKIALVQIPIKVFPATSDSEKISFNQLHGALRTAAAGETAGPCHARLKQKTVCPACDVEVKGDDVVKGFEFEKGTYVVLLPEELDAIAPASTRVIDLTQFADTSELAHYTVDRSYYLAPDGPLAAEALTVFRIATRHRVGVGKLAIYGREYLVAVHSALVPAPATYQDILMLHTLHHAAEIRSVTEIDALQTVAQAPVGTVRAFQQVIAALMGPLDLADFTDQYQVDLRRLIDDKIAGKEIVTPPAPLPQAIPVLKDALEQSLAVLTTKPKRMAKASLRPTKGAKVRT
jgi:DNA end-binding protein Ku